MFQEFPKIARLNRDVVVTEKIDGTNASVFITDSMDPFSTENEKAIAKRPVPDGFGRWELMFAGSRTRLITPEDDNYGFAKWVKANAEELWKLGPGRHFGEWWGQGIQRKYGLSEKRFSLFNTSRWVEDIWKGGTPRTAPPEGKQYAPSCCHVVPVILTGKFSTVDIAWAIEDLKTNGSMAAPGFMKPEGVVVYHTAANLYFKVTVEKDEVPKALAK